MGKFDKKKWARSTEENYERDRRIKRALEYMDQTSAMLHGISYKLDLEIRTLREEFELLCKDTIFDDLKNFNISDVEEK